MKKAIAVKLKGITKVYQLHHEKPIMADRFLPFSKFEKFKALDDVDLTIYKGEKVGIIGSNGSGKTTLLKIITGISTPTKGSVEVHGKVVSLIGLEAGFHPDLTGRENIFINGLIIGMTRQEIQENMDLIINFADIGHFIDAPLFTYSQGMKLRLGFAIAVHASPDILVLDEAVSAGDHNFQEKTNQKIQEFFAQGKTVIIVSHWIEFLAKNCKRIIWLEKSKVRRSGGVKVLKMFD